MISVLTPTGARPEAFNRCQEQMLEQDYTGQVLWVVIDDGPKPQKVWFRKPHWFTFVVYPEPRWEPGQNTHARNILAGLDHCADRVVMIEDDDQYDPNWITRCNGWLDSHDLVGEGGAVYENVNSGKKIEFNNSEHASMCSTAVKGPAVEWLRRAAREGDRFIDMRLWRYGRNHHLDRCKIYPNDGGVYGLKGGPGRPGIGSGHDI